MLLLDIGARIFVVGGLLWLLYVAASIIAVSWIGAGDLIETVSEDEESLELDLERAA